MTIWLPRLVPYRREVRGRLSLAHPLTWHLLRLVLVVVTSAGPLVGAVEPEALASRHASELLTGPDCNGNGVADEQDTLPLRFQAGTRFPVGNNPVAAVAADFDSDGDLDFAVTNLADRTVSVVRNNGFGVLIGPEPFPVKDYPLTIAAADFNRDGAVDLAVAVAQGVSVRYNDGNARFTQAAELPALSLISSIAAADVDGNGDLDLLYSGTSRAIYLATNEAGVWRSRWTLPLGQATGPVTAADLDSDGDTDLVLGNGVFVAANNGNGTFAGPTPVIGEVGDDPPTDVAIGDLDGDGDLDLASVFAGTPTPNSARIALNRGDATFDSGTIITLPADMIASHYKRLGIAAGDIDSDGDLDLAIVNRSALVAAVLRNRGDATFTADETHVTGAGYAVLVADANGDARLDLAVLAGKLVIMFNDGRGNLVSAPLRQVPVVTDPRGGPVSLVAADVDGDDDLDIATANLKEDSVSLLVNEGGRAFASPVTLKVASGPAWIAAGDLDGDGRADLAVANGDSDQVILLRYVGAGQLSTLNTLPLSQPSRVEFAHINQDRSPDLVTVSAQSLVSFRNDGSGQLIRDRSVDLSWVPTALAVGDLDRDGDDEAILTCDVDNAISVVAFPAEGDPIVTTLNSGGHPVASAAVDFDTNGTLDVVVTHDLPSSSESLTPVSVARNDGAGSLLPFVNLPIGVGGPLATGDLDGAGAPDLVIGSTVVPNYGLATVPRVTDFAVWPSVAQAVVADLDGDHRSEIAIAHSGSGAADATDHGGISVLWNESATATSPDCNLNRVPDECDTADVDCGSNGIPDDCEPDSDGDGYPDCADACPQDLEKQYDEGVCGCGQPELDINNDGAVDCGTPGPTVTWTSTETPSGPTPTATPTATPTRSPAHFVVDRVEDAVDANPGDGNCLTAGGGCTLRAAVQEANTLPGLDLITVPAGNYVLTVSGNGEDRCATGDLDVMDQLTVTGAGAETTTVDGNAKERVLQILPGADVSITALKIRNGRNADGGSGPGAKAVGGILNAGILTLVDCIVTENHAPSWVGSLWTGGTGGILNDGTLTLTNSAVTKNTGPDEGGILNVRRLHLNGATLNENRADDWGGALRNLGTATIISTRMEKNSAMSPLSGAIYNTGSLTLTDTTIAETSTVVGLSNPSGNVTAERSRIAGNRGGGIANGGTMLLTAATLDGNGGTMAIEGGAITNTGTLSVVETTISGNEGWTGGALGNKGNASVVNTTISGNRAHDKGGGLYNLGYLQLRSVTITNNLGYSSVVGGGLFSESSGTVRIQASVLAGNSAKSGSDCRGTVESEGYNLIGNPTDCTLAGKTVGDIIGIDPELGLLADNGGFTLTHLPGPRSPVVNAGAAAGSDCEAIDQRGVTRPQGAACDIGAVEVASRCGDGQLDDGEECDDGNTIETDCCSVLCQRLPVVGDCDGDSSVTVDELVRGVNIALGNWGLDRCSAFDADGNGRVTIDELVRGVKSALVGC